MKKASASIEKRIAEKIEEIKTFENDIPGVIIVMDISTLSVVYMSERGRNILKVTLDDLHEMGSQYSERFFNMEEAKDYTPFLVDLLNQNDSDKIVSFFQQVRATHHDPWYWYFIGAKVLLKDDNGLPLLMIITATPIDHMHYMGTKVQRLLDENNFLRNNSKLMNSLTKRETEILTLVATGLNTEKIANKMFLSKETVATHRKNIKRKLGFKSNYDFTSFAQAFDLI